MTDSNVLDKVRKLLRLATSSNANEAALAAAKAQELIDTYHLEQAMLDIDNNVQGLDDEPIVDFAKAGAPLDTPKQHDRWRTTLAVLLGRYNACSIYLYGRQIAIVGRPSDAETVRYLYAYLTREVERLATEIGQGMGRTWRNNFRLGVVDAISAKLKEQHAAFEQTARSSGQELMRVNQALARIDARRDSVQAWIKSNLKLRKGGSSYGGRNDSGARNAGRQAGATIRLGGGARLTSAAKRLN